MKSAEPEPVTRDAYQLVEAKEKIIKLQEIIIKDLKKKVKELETTLKITFCSPN